MCLALLLLFALLPREDSYVLLLTNKQKMVVKGPPVCEGARCTVVTLKGETTSLPSALIDQERTVAYNEDLAKKRDEVLKAKAEAEAAKAQAEAEALAKRKENPVILRADQKLKSYDRSSAGTSGSAVVESTEELVEDPILETYPSSGSAYVSESKISRYADHSVIDATVKVNDVSLDSIVVRLKVNFEPGGIAEETVTKDGPFKPGDSVTLSISIKSGEQILRLAWETVAFTVQPPGTGPTEPEKQ